MHFYLFLVFLLYTLPFNIFSGNFFRIRSAFAFGAKRLARLLDCPKENLIAEVNQFFMNTWDRHGSGHRPDAPSPDLWPLRPLNPDRIDGSENLKNYLSSKKMNENSNGHESEVEVTHALHGVSSQHGNYPLESMSRTSNMSAVSHSQSQKSNGKLGSSRISDQVARNISCNESSHTDTDQRSSRPDYLVNELQGRYQFVRTRSSPELTDTSIEVLPQGRRNRAPETWKGQVASTRLDYSSRRKNLGSEVSGSHSARSLTDQSLDASADSNGASNGYFDESGLVAMGEELASVAETMEMHQEEQDLVNMMASPRVHGFSGQVQMPMNLAPVHLPLPIYAQRNLAGMFPANIPLIEHPWGSNMQFPQGRSSPLSNYFPSGGVVSNQEEMMEPGNDNLDPTGRNQEDGDHVFLQEQDASSTKGLNPDDASFQMLQSDDKQPSISVGLKYVPSSRVSSSSGSSMRGQHKFIKENRGLMRDDHGDTFQYQNNRGNESYSSDRTANLRFFHSSQASSSRSEPSSESSWDGSSAKVSKSTRDKRGRKTDPSAVPSTVYGKGKGDWQYVGVSVDHASVQADDDNRDWIPLSTMGTEIAERNTGPASVASSHVRSHQIHGYEPAQMSGSDSVIPISPMLVSSGSRQRAMDNSGVVPFAFYPTGPPVPFLTMLPVCNFPTETGNSDASSSHFDREEVLDNIRIGRSDQHLDSAESLDQSEIFNRSDSMKETASEEHKSDILNSDFASHWHNLQFGRLCQNPRYNGPSPVVPPMYLQGHFPWDGPGRPNVNFFTQLMNYGSRFIPVTPIQPGSNRPASAYQHYGNEIPRYRGGTGTYLPNPKVSFRDRQSSSTRNHRGNYNNDRSDHHGDREGKWNISSKPRAAGRSHGRSQAEKPGSRLDRLAANDNRADRHWDSYRHESFSSYQSQNGPISSSNSMHSGSTNVAYGMYPLPAINSNGVSPTGPAGPPVVMFYSYDHNGGYGLPAEQLEFGSLRPVHFSGMNEVTQPDEGASVRAVYEQQRYREGSPARSSPDQPSSPQFQRSAAQRNYQLKDEDFPPLSFPNQGSNGGGSNYNGKSSHYQTTLFTPYS
ncbi:hypothetical protein HHK36_001286 [Tetracentron sinense]|uniref:PAP/OAS1 substrate-binding-related domain-containing protein n=1 Tax=Tetracentron sinense TaxID=13715 RepID=A0A835DR16_TETSI|nr:hypothetical protein HHK36_001286 [Tetracentron sinense]